MATSPTSALTAIAGVQQANPTTNASGAAINNGQTGATVPVLAVSSGLFTEIYSVEQHGGEIGLHVFGPLLPKNVRVLRAWYEGLTAPVSGGAATIVIGVKTVAAAGILGVTAYNGGTFAAGNITIGVPDGAIANATTKTSLETQQLQVAIAGADLTAGSFAVHYELFQCAA